jgi:hypothetical protein
VCRDTEAVEKAFNDAERPFRADFRQEADFSDVYADHWNRVWNALENSQDRPVAAYRHYYVDVEALELHSFLPKCASGLIVIDCISTAFDVAADFGS